MLGLQIEKLNPLAKGDSLAVKRSGAITGAGMEDVCNDSGRKLDDI